MASLSLHHSSPPRYLYLYRVSSQKNRVSSMGILRAPFLVSRNSIVFPPLACVSELQPIMPLHGINAFQPALPLLWCDELHKLPLRDIVGRVALPLRAAPRLHVLAASAALFVAGHHSALTDAAREVLVGLGRAPPGTPILLPGPVYPGTPFARHTGESPLLVCLLGTLLLLERLGAGGGRRGGLGLALGGQPGALCW